MSIINVMWSGGLPYASVHKVHQQILSQAAPGACIKTWLLQDQAAACLKDVGEVRAWQLSSKVLKGRGIRALSGFWLRRGFHKALLADDALFLLITRTTTPAPESRSDRRQSRTNRPSRPERCPRLCTLQNRSASRPLTVNDHATQSPVSGKAQIRSCADYPGQKKTRQ